MIPSRVEDLFATANPPVLGPQRRADSWDRRDAAAQTDAFCESASIDGPRAEILRALVLLWHDHLDDAHAIVQDLSGADAAFVHGIMHRREPDFSNARYWFHRVGNHPALGAIAEAAAPMLARHAAIPDRLIRDGAWDPFAFIDAVAVGSRQPETSPEVGLLRELQRAESVTLARHLAGA